MSVLGFAYDVPELAAICVQQGHKILAVCC